MRHVPVLLKEVLEVMAPADGGRYFDGTLGDGGHAAGILDASSPTGEIAGCDVDPRAVARARANLAPYGERAHIFTSSYTAIGDICRSLGWETVDGILVDLGMSSVDVEQGTYGFSFLKEGPLDMRYDPNAPLTASDVVNGYDERRLAGIIRELGEERFASKIARHIVASRPVRTTTDLAEIVSRAIPRAQWPARIHPATRTFQAIRMEVNAELDNLREFLPRAAGLLAPQGVLAVISFHSLEDRIVKRFMSGPRPSPLQARLIPVPPEHRAHPLAPLTKKPVRASQDEVTANPRARSARLRAARRIP